MVDQWRCLELLTTFIDFRAGPEPTVHLSAVSPMTDTFPLVGR